MSIYTTNEQKTKLVKTRQLKILQKDFDGWKEAFNKYLKSYYGDIYKDFTEASSGQALVELFAFIGDVLSYDLDYNFKELLFIQQSKEIKNVVNIAKNMYGYKVLGPSSAVGELDLYIEIPALNGEIDTQYATTILRNSSFIKSSDGVSYLISDDCDFSKNTDSNPYQKTVSEVDSNGAVTYFALKKTIDGRAGRIKETTFDLSDASYESFRKLVLPDENVVEIDSVTDSEGNIWYEVNYLAQDTVFVLEENTNSDSSSVSFVLKLKAAPKRFVREYDIETGLTIIRFGSGDAKHSNSDIVPNIDDLALPIYGKKNFASISIDPVNYLKSNTLGLTPYGTNIIVRYIVCDGAKSNAAANEIDTVGDIKWSIATTGLENDKLERVINSIEVNNSEKWIGGGDIPNIETIKEYAIAEKGTQDRIVTDIDLLIRLYSMPQSLGNVFRLSTKFSDYNSLVREIYVLSKDSSDNLTTATSTLKQNIKNYSKYYRITPESFEIWDGKIINITLDYKIIVEPGQNKFEILANCNNELKEYFNINKWQMGQSIVLSQIESLLQEINGVYAISDIEIDNTLQYGGWRYNIKENTEDKVIFCPIYGMFEIRDLNSNIKGIAK